MRPRYQKALPHTLFFFFNNSAFLFAPAGRRDPAQGAVLHISKFVAGASVPVSANASLFGGDEVFPFSFFIKRETWESEGRFSPARGPIEILGKKPRRGDVSVRPAICYENFHLSGKLSWGQRGGPGRAGAPRAWSNITNDGGGGGSD